MSWNWLNSTFSHRAGEHARVSGQQLKGLRGLQPVLGLAVQGLDLHHGGIAPAGVVLKLALKLRQVVLEGGKVGIRGGIADVPVQYGLQGVHCGDGGPAAVVAHAVKAHFGDAVFAAPVCQLPGLGHRALRIRGGVAAVGHVGGDAVSLDPGAVRADPPEGVLGEVIFLFDVPHGPHVYIIVHAGELQYLGQHGVVAEGVHVVAGLAGDAECPLIIPLAVEGVPGEGLAAWRVAVRLDPPAAHDPPAALGHPLLDLFEHDRVHFLDPFVILGPGAGEHVAVKVLHPLQGALEGGHYLGAALLPPPQPHGIQMSVSDQVYLFGRIHGHASSKKSAIRAGAHMAE